MSIKRFARGFNRKLLYRAILSVVSVFLIKRKAVDPAGKSEASTHVDGKRKEYTYLPLNSCATGLSCTDHNVDHVDSTGAHA